MSHNRFFLIQAIYGIGLDPNNSEKVMEPLETPRNLLAIDLYANSSLIFYSNERTKTISQVSRVGTARKTVISSGLRRPKGLAVDWVAGNLFWADSGNNVIEVGLSLGLGLGFRVRGFTITCQKRFPALYLFMHIFGIIFKSNES